MCSWSGRLLLPAAILAAVSVSAVSSPGRQVARPQNRATEDRLDRFWQRALVEIYRSSEELGAQHDREVRKRVDLGTLLRGNPREKTVALTFDDGPHPQWTERLLAVLKQEKVPATFFLVGKQAEKYPELVRSEVADGHLVANHTFSHVTLTKIPLAEIETEYRACNDVIRSITGQTPAFCRPPGGDYDPDVVKGASAVGLTTVLWTDDPGDYASPGDNRVEARTLARISNGGIILMHDGIQQTLDVLPQLIRDLRARGYKFVTVDKLASRKSSTRTVNPSLAKPSTARPSASSRRSA